MEVLGKNIFVGCDPEVFVCDSKTGKPVSAHGLIRGTKYQPQKVKDGMVQVDGMALEFGVDPCANEDEFFTRIQSVLVTLTEMLPKGLELNFSPIVEFSEEIMAKQPPEALELGCEPDYNCYTLLPNPKPVLPNPNLRSAGGHVHVGWDANLPVFHPEHIKTCAALTAEMDYRLGMPSLQWDSNATRRSIYGAAGAYRPKPYGMEYRTLSNQWLSSEKLIRFVYRQTIKSVKNTLEGKNNFNDDISLYQGVIKSTPKQTINSNFVLAGNAVFASEF